MRESAPLPHMHDNRVLELDKGRWVFRPAMTIQTDPADIKRRFNKDNFALLEDFYRERALQLVNACFTLLRRRFLRKWFKGRNDLLDLATPEVSFRRIVDDPQHPVQQSLVEMPEHGNHLVLAGPG